ncbi:hypothetical protein Lal_00042052 [Lupinus albus]|nr:hypothetical protein Lal_00042052 [Lupinus albus]
MKSNKMRRSGVHAQLWFISPFSNDIKHIESNYNLPQSPKNLDALHRVEKRGNQDVNWATKHAHWIEYWSHRSD